jgi:hypothetical protein
VDILARVTAALNTDLEGATTELDMTHRELQNAQARIARSAYRTTTARGSKSILSFSVTSTQETSLWYRGSNHSSSVG